MNLSKIDKFKKKNKLPMCSTCLEFSMQANNKMIADDNMIHFWHHITRSGVKLVVNTCVVMFLSYKFEKHVDIFPIPSISIYCLYFEEPEPKPFYRIQNIPITLFNIIIGMSVLITTEIKVNTNISIQNYIKDIHIQRTMFDHDVFCPETNLYVKEIPKVFCCFCFVFNFLGDFSNASFLLSLLFLMGNKDYE